MTDMFANATPNFSFEIFPPKGAGKLSSIFETVDALERSVELCAETGCHIVMKGYRSRIFTPHGECLVNTTGNPGMAKGGSGDVLTGLIGGLLARGYRAEDAAALGVWIHGRAGDILTALHTAEAYDSRDLIGELDEGFCELYDLD